MKKMQCEVCGSTEIKKVDETTFECQSCGVQYSKEDLQKLLVEITGAVKIDRSSEVEKIMKNAMRLYETNDCEKSYDLFCDVLNIDPQNCDALLYTGLSWVWQSKSNDIKAAEANHYFKDAINTKFEQVGDTAEFYDFTGTALKEIIKSLKSIYAFIIEQEEKSIKKEESIENIGAGTLVQLNNRAFAKKKYDLAVNKWRGYFGDIYEQLLSTLKNLNLSNYEAGSYLFFTEYVDLMETRYFNVFVGKTALIEQDKQTIEKFGIKKEAHVVQKFSEKLNNPAITNSGRNARGQKGRNTKVISAEKTIHTCAILGLIPFPYISLIGGLSILFYINKAKKENDGKLTKKIKRDIILGIGGAIFWTLATVVFFIVMNEIY